jgi:type VI secretion system protein ImpM
MDVMGETVEVGIYGKLPSHGDFLQRRVPPEFLTPWDEWLQGGIAASRAALANQWTNTYLTSPVWRFALSASACGRAPVAGLMAPSVDRVGRFFPLTLVWRLPTRLPPIVYASLCSAPLASAEQLLIDGLTADSLDFEHFDEQVTLLGPSVGAALASAADPLDGDDLDQVSFGMNFAWHLPTGSSGALMPTLSALLARKLDFEYQPLTLWWTDGSAAVEPCCLVVRGMPASDAFVSLLDGSWNSGQWRSVRTVVTESPRPITAPVVRAVPATPALPPQLRSAGLSEAGPRPSNQDAFLERTPIGLWAVADGLGGLSQGEVASQMVCGVLASLAPNATLEGTIEDVRHSLDEVNANLYRASQRPLDPVQSCSTVVVMAMRETRAAILWAGDSRAYRLRRGTLERLSTDHSEESPTPDTTIVRPAQADPPHPAQNPAVTRAVGGTETLELDLRVEPAEPGDRYLLCSDGVSRALDDRRLTELLTAAKDPEACARELLAAAKSVPADDNVTAVVIDS